MNTKGSVGAVWEGPCFWELLICWLMRMISRNYWKWVIKGIVIRYLRVIKGGFILPRSLRPQGTGKHRSEGAGDQSRKTPKTKGALYPLKISTHNIFLEFRPEDLAKSLLYMTSFNIAQLSYLWAQKEKCN